MATLGSFETLVHEFSKRIAELREATLLRVDDTTRQLYAHDLEAIEGTLRALELKAKDIRAFIHREKETIPQVEAVVAACELQRHHLQHICTHLPAFLPSLDSPQPILVQQSSGPANNRENSRECQGNAHSNAGAPVKKKAQLVKRYITQDELNSLSSYMRGRLTIDKVNSALDELAVHAEGNAALVAACRRNKVLGGEKKHGQWLLYNIANKDICKGKFWVLESDMKTGTNLRLDKTGKSILTVLRHLNRCQEARITVEGTTHLVYIIS